MNASDVMTSNVITVRQDAPVRDAIRLMLDHGISGLPVTDDSGRMVGILSEGDLLRRAEMQTERQHSRWLEFLLGPGRLADEYTHTHGRKVGEIMTKDIVSVVEDTPLAEIVRLMERYDVKRLPVRCGGALVGIVTRADLMRALAKLVDQSPTSTSGDDEIRKRLLAELERTAWAPLGSVTIAVHDGVVELDGVITNEKEREAVHVAAENVPGVKGVHDHLVWVEPLSGTVIEAP
jgi:CBS-domain-containing membrane protein